MKRQYFTDQRDYFKYSILRHLQARDTSQPTPPGWPYK